MSSQIAASLATVATAFLSRQGLAPGTLKSYQCTLLPFLQEYGSMPIEILTRQAITEYLDDLESIAYTTHHRHQAIIQSLFNFAVEEGYIKSNPILGLKRRKPDRAKGEHDSDEIIRYLTPEQLEMLYQLVKHHLRMNALVHLLHGSGARISELLALDLRDVNQSERKFQVVGKGNRKRWCFYGEDAAVALDYYLKYDRHAKFSALFTAQQPFTLEVSRLSYRSAHDNWCELTADAPELADAHLHDLRHTFATERVGLMGIEELRALMGHRSIQTTLRYQKVTSQRAETVAKQALKSLQNAD
ncbi:tyrosine-type recombinase/integrase [Leptolyngbya sp. NIES-2104]|uniref:tyrosine-type recombinase/integrase n=1 Tax=Leptolyngbya sp. NIES-2104 TaxID=1552121 RepID=UPI0006EC99ED|nr:tyrosine-type recombinase/integrase [Leptolyngbya sp. NIES-2104]GAP96701.1 integrase [Leptolyngbya sp. NIES-2104]